MHARRVHFARLDDGAPVLVRYALDIPPRLDGRIRLSDGARQGVDAQAATRDPFGLSGVHEGRDDL